MLLIKNIYPIKCFWCAHNERGINKKSNSGYYRLNMMRFR